MPRIELAISVGNGDKTAVVSKLYGTGTLAETVELLAVAAHAIMELAHTVDRDSSADGNFVANVMERMQELNVNPQSAGVVACRIETITKGNPDEQQPRDSDGPGGGRGNS